MSFLDSHLVNLVIFLPLVFAAIVAALPGTEKGQIRTTALIGMGATLLFALWMYLRFVPNGPEFQLEYRARWLDSLGISFHTGVDGLSVSLMLLTAFLGPWVVLASWTFIDARVKEFHLAVLSLQTAMLGALGSMDLVLFYVFWEAMLVPMYLLMLVAILALYFISQPTGPRSFDYAQIYNALISASRQVSTCAAGGSCDQLSPVALSLKTYGPWMFVAFAVAFAVKVPMFPVHTWLPDAHVQAPVAGSMILAGVMLKMGTFGFWRYAIPLFPTAARQFRPVLATLAIIGIVYGALMCLAQRDVKKLIAYSSVSHLGLCMLGMLALTVEGASGSAYQMLNHGISTGALFLLFGMLYERMHTRWINEFGGLAKVMPLFATAFLIITFSSIAVPGTNSFVGEFLVLLGTFRSTLPLPFGVLGALGIILGAAYMLWMVQRVFFGLPTHRDHPPLTDLNLREVVTALPFVLGLSGSTVSDSAVEMKVMPLPEAGSRMRSDREPPGSREKLRATRQ